MIRLFFPCLFLLLFACDNIIPAPEAGYGCALTDPPSEHPLADQLQAAINQAIPLTTGIQAAVTFSDDSQWTGSAGYANIDVQENLQPCHRIMIASISKTVTATMVLQLEDRGLLSIDDRLSAYLEEDLIGEIANAREATLRQLLNHTSGIPDYLNARQTFNTFNEPFFRETQREKLAYVYGEEALHAPGADFSYSNTNYVLLGLVIEQVTQQPLWNAVEEQVVRPLALTRFVMGTEEDPIPEDVARPYFAFRGGKFIDVLESAVSDAATGDGGIAANMQDLNIFARGLFGGGLISERALGAMQSDMILVGEEEADFSEWPDEAYGLGLNRYQTPFGTAYGHTGSTSSYNSLMLHFPDEGITISLISTGLDLERLEEYGDLVEVLRDQLIDLAFSWPN
ncbi:serine hydrolase [Lewinella sp. W8]|uniref:serine hydrolase domain-containing protein n=1 Tax=Lewinella sp. W8 TaxID=2528208 RepID=UPI00156702C4|nr:serine hydrolase domain-containing protein [Lewinella sp. W8]